MNFANVSSSDAVSAANKLKPMLHVKQTNFFKTATQLFCALFSINQMCLIQTAMVHINDNSYTNDNKTIAYYIKWYKNNTKTRAQTDRPTTLYSAYCMLNVVDIKCLMARNRTQNIFKNVLRYKTFANCFNILLASSRRAALRWEVEGFRNAWKCFISIYITSFYLRSR